MVLKLSKSWMRKLEEKTVMKIKREKARIQFGIIRKCFHADLFKQVYSFDEGENNLFRAKSFKNKQKKNIKSKSEIETFILSIRSIG